MINIQIINSDSSAAAEETTGELTQSFVPNAAQVRTEQQIIEKSVCCQDSSSCNNTQLMWPATGGTPINEFKHKDICPWPFPHCFQLVQLIFLAIIRIMSQLVTFSNICYYTKMGTLLRTGHVFVFLP